MTRRFKLTLAYQGTAYHGWQIQAAGKATIQQTVQDALSIVLKESIQIVGASRTDAGVHALGQVAHFDSATDEDPYRLRKSLSALVPTDISVVALEEVDFAFHAQESVQLKQYAYYVYLSPLPYTFWESYAWQLPPTLDIAAMQAALPPFVGRHNFLGFCASDSTAKTFEREVSAANIERIAALPFLGNADSLPLYAFRIAGKGFLKFMIRNIMGTLVEIGQGKRDTDSIQELLLKQDRRLAGPTAPAKGLFLEKIIYRG